MHACNLRSSHERRRLRASASNRRVRLPGAGAAESIGRACTRLAGREANRGDDLTLPDRHLARYNLFVSTHFSCHGESPIMAWSKRFVGFGAGLLAWAIATIGLMGDHAIPR